MSSPLRAVPKPTSEKALSENEAVLHIRGGHGAIKSVVNALRQIGIVSTEPYYKRADGSVDQKVYVTVYEVAKRYAEPPERPYEDKSADIYVMLSDLEPDKVKVGLSIHVRVREKQVSRKFKETFGVIHVVHAQNAKQRETWIHNHLREMGAVDLGYEQFRVKDDHLDWLRSLPNE